MSSSTVRLVALGSTERPAIASFGSDRTGLHQKQISTRFSSTSLGSGGAEEKLGPDRDRSMSMGSGCSCCCRDISDVDGDAAAVDDDG